MRKITKQIREIYYLLYFLITSVGCSNHNVNKIHCVYDSPNDKMEATYICYYQPSGNIYTMGTKIGIDNINEEIHYYDNGVIKQYAFYNPNGEQRFLRNYDNHGSLIEEHGTFFGYLKTNTTGQQKTLGDSVTFDFHIAAPPDTYFKFFLIDQDGRHEITWMDTIASYCRRLTIFPKKEGSYALHYEVEFYDMIKGSKKIRKDDISFDMITANHALQITPEKRKKRHE